MINSHISLSSSLLAASAEVYEQELNWLSQVIDVRLKKYFKLETDLPAEHLLSPPVYTEKEAPYVRMIEKYGFSFAERVAIALCLASHLRPQLLDVFFTKNKTFDRNFVEFGGIRNQSTGPFEPTGETLLFILSGTVLTKRLEALPLLQLTHRLFRHHILNLQAVTSHESRQQQVLKLSAESEAELLLHQRFRPRFGNQFPAKPLETQQNWEDLVLPAYTLEQVQEILTWIEHGHTLMQEWGMRKKIRPGYRCLLYGPPGTGKTLTASLLGKASGREVYRVDLSMVVSKYIGETEKNLSKVFDLADHRDWILFFDEADALFGKRTQVQDAHDRYANQEVSYLLQRIEQFEGIVILASNLRGNLDEAFTRRFESMVYFPIPGPRERLQIWRKGFSGKLSESLCERVDLENIAQEYEIPGGIIMNVIRYVSLQAIANETLITQKDILRGIRRELAKESKTI